MSADEVNLRFGAVPYDWEFRLDSGHRMTPLPEFGTAWEWIAKYKCDDGFLHAPLTWRVREDGREVPNSEKPANLFRVPATHEFHLSSYDESEDPRNADAGFLMHFLGCLLGIRLQFEEWWVDLRIPSRATHHFCLRVDQAEHVLNHAYDRWLTWNKNKQLSFTTLLYMHCRAVGYRWNWERFAIEYMVFDGLFRFARNLCGSESVPHSRRIKHMCERFGLAMNPVAMQVATARNELFHEALWAGDQPCSANDGQLYVFDGHLHRLNNRLFLAIIGYVNTYVRSSWWTFGNTLFDLPESTATCRF